MPSTVYTLKYSVADSVGVVGQSAFKEIAKFDTLDGWKFTDQLNELRVFEFSIPNDVYGRSNAILEREIFLPFAPSIKGMVVGKASDNSLIDMVAKEFATHLERRTMRILTDAKIDYVTSDVWYNTNWKYRRKIYINGDILTSDLVNIPLQIHNEHGVLQPVIPIEAESDGKDIFVTAADGVTPIPYEIEVWNDSTNELVLRFKAPKLKDSNNGICYVYFGNPSAVDAQSPGTVWNNNYAMVLHCSEDAAITDLLDSTNNNNDGVPTSCVREGGHHGTGVGFDGDASVVNCGSGATLDDFWTSGGKFDCWIFPESDGEGDAGIIATKGTWIIQTVDESAGFLRIKFTHTFTGDDGIWQTDRTIPINAQTKIAIEYDSSTTNPPIIYINGESVTVNLVQTPTGTADSDAANDFLLGNNAGGTAGYSGWLDEIRVHSITRGAEWERADYRNEVMDTNEHPWFLRWDDKIELVESATNVIAQEILDYANLDMPAGVTWKLGDDFPTTVTTIHLRYKNCFEALNLLAESIGKDLWFDNDSYKVFIGTKGKTISDKLDLVITTKPDKTVDNFANMINIIGHKRDDGVQIAKSVNTSTILRYNYEKNISDPSLGTEDHLTSIGNALLEEFQKLVPSIKGTIPYNQFIRFNLQSGDIIPIIQPENDLIGNFRIVKLVATQKNVTLNLENTSTGVVRTKSQSITDIIEGIIRKITDQSID